MIRTFVLLSILCALVVSCATAPDPLLTLDVSAVETPVMLSEVARPMGPELTLQSGKVRLSVTTRAGYGATYTRTVTMTEDLNQPLAEQLANTLIQAPDWLAVTDLSLWTEKSSAVFASTSRQLLRLSIIAATEGR